MSRFTFKDLQEACDNVNKTLNNVLGEGKGYRYSPQSRNGYSAVDVYMDNRCLYTVGTGTPRECYGALYVSAFGVISEAFKKD